jgi:hypothetical protein
MTMENGQQQRQLQLQLQLQLQKQMRGSFATLRMTAENW